MVVHTLPRRVTSGAVGSQRAGMTEELRTEINQRVDAVQRHYHRHGRVFRVVWLVAAFLVIAAGLAMLVFPGPAVIVIPIGFAMLAVRFRWAQTALRTFINHGVRLQRRVSKASPAIKAACVAAALCVAAAVAVLVLR